MSHELFAPVVVIVFFENPWEKVSNEIVITNRRNYRQPGHFDTCTTISKNIIIGTQGFELMWVKCCQEEIASSGENCPAFPSFLIIHTFLNGTRKCNLLSYITATTFSTLAHKSIALNIKKKEVHKCEDVFTGGTDVNIMKLNRSLFLHNNFEYKLWTDVCCAPFPLWRPKCLCVFSAVKQNQSRWREWRNVPYHMICCVNFLLHFYLLVIVSFLVICQRLGEKKNELKKL
jgi:hypothetical protein